MSFDVATVGDNCIDQYLPPIDCSLVGGNALNVAVNLRRHGHTVRYVGMVGNDPDGRTVMAAARAAGLDVSEVEIGAGTTGVTTIRLGPEGEREFVAESLGTSAGYVPPPAVVRRLATSDWVHCATLPDDTAWLAGLAKRSVRLSYDFSHPARATPMAALCPHLEVAFLSLPGGHREAGLKLAREAVGLGARSAVVTLGAVGSIGVTARVSIHRQALEVDTVDTLGAGDAYIAGTVDALLAGADLDQAMSAGSADAAAACRHLGAWPQPLASLDKEVS
ncbi:MAG TPA: PfkB family carbohydrate kinase [Gaiellales bacterium]|nr:PfkB family carbohydrate kinase [Gaiellales bacterium]